MTNEQILLQAIKKSIKNGWIQDLLDPSIIGDCEYDEELQCIHIPFGFDVHVNAILFDKEFWKGLLFKKGEDGLDLGDRMRYHIQKIALEDNRIGYLKQFINES